MDGQRFLSALVDLAFFGVVALFGYHRILSEAVLATLLSAYTAHRFGIASGKQQAIVALGGASGASGGSVPPSGGSGTGASQRMPAVREEPTPPNPRDPRRMQRDGAARLDELLARIG